MTNLMKTMNKKMKKVLNQTSQILIEAQSNQKESQSTPDREVLSVGRLQGIIQFRLGADENDSDMKVSSRNKEIEDD